jgi:hypothetical protein
LADNRGITRLSLTYCDLSPVCGNPIGRLLVQTAIAYIEFEIFFFRLNAKYLFSEIYLDGNQLGCQGAYDLIKLLLNDCEKFLIDKQDKLRAENELKAQEG